MKSIESLPKTTFGGRRFTRKQLTRVQETVQTFSRLYLFSGFQRGKRPSQWGEARDGSRSSTYGCGERSKATRYGTGSLSC